MDLATLMYYTGILQMDVGTFSGVSTPQEEIPDAEFRRALNASLDAIRADIANIQHLIDG